MERLLRRVAVKMVNKLASMDLHMEVDMVVGEQFAMVEQEELTMVVV